MPSAQNALAFYGGVTRLSGSSVLRSAGSGQFEGEPMNLTMLANSYRAHAHARRMCEHAYRTHD